MINFELIRLALPALLKGALVTLQITATAFILGITGGTILGIAHTSKNKVLEWLVSTYVTIIRGTPMLIQIMVIYFVLPKIGLHLPATLSAIVAIGLNSSAYVSQIIRSGIRSVPKGQIEAAQTLGISKSDTLRYIILPQALRVVLPALGNESVTLIKDSSLASYIGVAELFKEGQTVISQTYDSLSVYFVLAGIYLIMTTTVSYLVMLLERRSNRHVKNN